MDTEFHDSQQPDADPASPPLASTVHHVNDTTNGSVPNDQNNQFMPVPGTVAQGDVDGSERQGLVANPPMEVEASRATEPPRLQLNREANIDNNPASICPDQPWTSLQTTHSQHLGSLGFRSAQPSHGIGLPLDHRLYFDSLHVQQPGSNQNYPFQGFVPTGNLDPTICQQIPRFGGPFDFSAPSGGFVFPEALPSIPPQQSAGPSTPFTTPDPSLGFTLNQDTPSEIATQGAEVASVASASSTSSGTRARSRRARGEVRRGQPKPKGWTEEEVGILTRMYGEKKVDENVSQVTKRIAETLGKSTGAVEAKYWRLRGSDPKASKNRRDGCGGSRGGRQGHNGRDGSGGAGAGLAV